MKLSGNGKHTRWVRDVPKPHWVHGRHWKRTKMASGACPWRSMRLGNHRGVEEYPRTHNSYVERVSFNAPDPKPHEKRAKCYSQRLGKQKNVGGTVHSSHGTPKPKNSETKSSGPIIDKLLRGTRSWQNLKARPCWKDKTKNKQSFTHKWDNKTRKTKKQLWWVNSN